MKRILITGAAGFLGSYKITYEYFKSLSPEELSKEEHKDFTDYIK